MSEHSIHHNPIVPRATWLLVDGDMLGVVGIPASRAFYGSELKDQALRGVSFKFPDYAFILNLGTYVYDSLRVQVPK